MFISVPVAGLVKVLFVEIRDLYRSIDRPGGFGSADADNPMLSPLIEAAAKKKERSDTAIDRLINRFRKKKP